MKLNLKKLLLVISFAGVGYVSMRLWAMEQGEPSEAMEVEEAAAITIETADDKKVRMPKDLAFRSSTLEHIAEFPGEGEEIPLPFNRSEIQAIVDALKKIREEEELPGQFGVYFCSTHCVNAIVEEILEQKNKQGVIDFIRASNFLDLPQLVNGGVRVYVQGKYVKSSLGPLLTSNLTLGNVEEKMVALNIPQDLLGVFEKQLLLKKAGKTEETSVGEFIIERGKAGEPFDPQSQTYYFRSSHLTSLEGLEGIKYKNTTKDLKLDNNNFVQIPAHIFKGWNQLKELDLSANNIMRIDQNAFEGLDQVQVIDLYANQLSMLDPQVFQGLSKLKRIKLSRNPLPQEEVDKLRQALPDVEIEF